MLIMRWTEKENQTIINNKLLGMTYVEITKLLPSRNYRSVRAQGFKLLGGISPKKSWSEQEEQDLLILRDIGYKYNEISEVLGRTKNSVAVKVQNLINEGRAISLHGSYSKEELLQVVKDYKKVTLCPYDKLYHIKKEFGSWSQAACEAGVQVSGLDPRINTTLYLIKFPEFYKVGITQQTVKSRFYGVKLEYKVIDYYDTTLCEARELEKAMLKHVSIFKYTPEELVGNGGSECFKTDQPLFQLEDIFSLRAPNQ